MMIIIIVSASTVASADVRVFYEGKELEFDVKPQIVDDRVLVPLRAVFETLGAGVEWDKGTETVIATKDGITVELKIGARTAYKNGKSMELDVEPQIIKGRIMVPLRFIGG